MSGQLRGLLALFRARAYSLRLRDTLSTISSLWGLGDQMNKQHVTAIAIVLVTTVAPSGWAGQAPDGWTVPRTADGRPDLQGIWANDSATPFQRPEALGNRATLTDEEVAAMQAYAVEYDRVGGDAVFGDTPYLRALASLEEPSEAQAPASPARRSTRSYNQFWMIDRWFDNRTSLIVDPQNGRLPERTPEAQSRVERLRAERGKPGADGRLTLAQEVASVDPAIRCRGAGALLSGRGYNSNYQIFQSASHMAIQIEMHHETRIIPIGDAAPNRFGPASNTGSSAGHWEGDTLVVDTTNLKRGVSGSTADARLTERFTRVGPEMLQYEYTVDDSATWAQPWTARMFLRPAPGTGVIYEFACHEGNYAIEHALRNERFLDDSENR